MNDCPEKAQLCASMDTPGRTCFVVLLTGVLYGLGVVVETFVLSAPLNSVRDTLLLILWVTTAYTLACAGVWVILRLGVEVAARLGGISPQRRVQYAFMGLFFVLGTGTLAANTRWISVYHSNLGSWGTTVGVIAMFTAKCALSLVIAGALAWILDIGRQALLRRARVGTAVILGGASAVIIGLAALSARSNPAPPGAVPSVSLAALPTPTPVLLIGADGLDWAILQDLFARGELPTLKRLVEEGVAGPIRSLPFSSTPQVWPCIETGILPPRTGIVSHVIFTFPGMRGGVQFPLGVGVNFFFRILADETGLIRYRRISHQELQAYSVWEILGRANKRSGVVNWFASWPAYPIKGYLASTEVQRLLLDQRGGQQLDGHLPVESYYTYPPAYLTEIAKSPVTDLDELLITATHDLFQDKHVDLVVVYENYTDAVGHRSFKFYRPDLFPFIASEDIARYGDDLPAAYRQLDRLVAGLLNVAPKDLLVVLVSDHGMEAVFGEWTHPGGGSHLNATPGVVIFHGPHVRAGSSLLEIGLEMGVEDIAPTLLYYLGVAISRELDGRAAREVFTPEFQRGRDPGWVDSYGWPDRDEWDATASTYESEALEQLKALGYIQ